MVLEDVQDSARTTEMSMRFCPFRDHGLVAALWNGTVISAVPLEG